MTTRIWIVAFVGLCIFSVPASAEVWHGLYTDATSYAIGDTIKVYASAPNQEVVIRLVKLDEFWTEAARSDVLEAGPQSSRVGSFVEYPSLSLGGRTSFTLEGWLHPTLAWRRHGCGSWPIRPERGRRRDHHYSRRTVGRLCERYAANRPGSTRHCPVSRQLRHLARLLAPPGALL